MNLLKVLFVLIVAVAAASGIERKLKVSKQSLIVFSCRQEAIEVFPSNSR